MLIPKEKIQTVLNILNSEQIQAEEARIQKLLDNLWADLLEDLGD